MFAAPEATQPDEERLERILNDHGVPTRGELDATQQPDRSSIGKLEMVLTRVDGGNHKRNRPVAATCFPSQPTYLPDDYPQRHYRGAGSLSGRSLMTLIYFSDLGRVLICCLYHRCRNLSADKGA